MLKHVLTNSPFYKEYYGQNGITIDNYYKTSLQDLPTIDKKLMMENYDDLVCDRALKRQELEEFIADPSNLCKKYLGRYTVIHTSSSSGRIGIFVYDRKAWNIPKAIGIGRLLKNKPNPFKRLKFASIIATDGMYAVISSLREMPKLFVNYLPLSINSPLEEIMAKINAFQPDIQYGYSSGIYLLAQEQKRVISMLNQKELSARPIL